MRRFASSLTVVLCCLVGRTAWAACYELPIPDSPERGAVASGSSSLWCYELMSTSSGHRETLVYRAGRELRLETTALVSREPDGGIIRLAHGSRTGGRLGLHAIDGAPVNPLPVPLDEREASRLGRAVAATPAPADERRRAAARLRSVPTQYSQSLYFLVEGTFAVQVGVAPFGGYWWPYARQELAAGAFSPLGKYDGYVEARTGASPNSRIWESLEHALTGVSWAGHCNGWAASSILYEEPAGPVWDTQTDTVFFVSDVNGLHAEASFCVDFAFYGLRYRGPGDDLSDVRPDKFHKVLLYYLQHLSKPIAMDVRADEPVDNSVVTGYELEITRDPLMTNRYHVVARLSGHGYDSHRNETVGVAVGREWELAYDLVVDAAGNIAGGEWTGGWNPDFLWVPLAPGECGGENPLVDDALVAEIAALPAAERRFVAQPFLLEQPLSPGQEIEIMGPLERSQPRLVLGTVALGPHVYLVARGHVLRPAVDTVGVQVREVRADDVANGTWNLDLAAVESITLVNRGNTPSGDAFFVAGFEAWGPSD